MDKDRHVTFKGFLDTRLFSETSSLHGFEFEKFDMDEELTETETYDEDIKDTVGSCACTRHDDGSFALEHNVT